MPGRLQLPIPRRERATRLNLNPTCEPNFSPAHAANMEEKSYFETQREALIGEIAMSFEQVLANINKLNRSLESVIAVGNEFSSVEALWSQFENVMAKDDEAKRDEAHGQDEQRDSEKKGEQ